MSKEDDAFGQAYRNEIMALQATIHEMQIQMARAYRAGWQAAKDEKYENRSYDRKTYECCSCCERGNGPGFHPWKHAIPCQVCQVPKPTWVGGPR